MARPPQGTAHQLALGLAAILSCNPTSPEGSTRSEASAGPPQVDSASVASVDTWIEHTSKTCQFSVRLPPSLSAQPTPPGLLDQLAVEDDQLKVALIASCGDVPSVSSPEQFLDITSTVIARQLYAHIDRRTPLDLDGRPGLELSMTIAGDARPAGIFWPGDLTYRLRLYVAGQRQYQLHAVHSAAALVDDLEAHFFAGFRLLDGAPAAPAALTWTTHTIAGVSVQAPGSPQPIDTDLPDLIEAVRFGAPGRSTPFAVSIWTARPLGDPADPLAALHAHFQQHLATPTTQIIEQTPHRAASHPALEIRYRPNAPLPPHITDDPEAKAAVQQHLERQPPESRVRLILTNDRIIELRATNPSPDDDPTRFFTSLKL